MKTQVLLPTDEAVAYAAQVLREGGLVGMPTETVYGLAANALDEEAVRGIFAAKGRPADNPLIVHVNSIEEAEKLCVISDASRELMAHFCPGPLTVTMPRRSCVPDVVTAGLDTVAIRIPSHPVARRLIAQSGLPIAAPSANTSGKPSPTTAQHVYHDLDGRLPVILDGGECDVGLESTVITMAGDMPTVLRPGGITPEMLLTVLPEVRVADSVLRPLKQGEKALSPGMMYKHYAPGGMLTMVKGEQANVQRCCLRLYDEAKAAGHTVRILAFEEHLDAYKNAEVLPIGRLSEPETVSHKLFAILRQMDDEGVDVLYSEILPAEGLGLAIMNRLSRAAGFRTIDADVTDPFLDVSGLTDGEITLSLDRTAPGMLEKNWLPAYHFAICGTQGVRMGKCDLRIGHNDMVYFGGNIGYEVFEEYRGHHYAAKSCRLLFQLAKKHGMDYVIITCAPDNLPSRKTLEGLGGKLLEIADLPADSDMRERGMTEVCIFRFDLPQ